MVVPAWQYRRSRFNHDWLKNQYIPALGKLQNLLVGRIDDVDNEAIFVDRIMTEWLTHRDEALALPSDFEAGMTPRGLFQHKPLSSCDEETVQWLGELIHGLWLARYPVHRWITEASAQAHAADHAFDLFHEALLTGDNFRTRKPVQSLPLLCANFYGACCKLAKAIEKFPSNFIAI